MRSLFFLLVFFSFCTCCTAQFSDSIQHHIKFETTGTLNKVKSGSSYLLSNFFNYNTRKKYNALNTAAGWIYAVNGKQLSNNDLSLHADMNFFKPGKKLYYWTLANFDVSYSLKINYRLQTGAGLSYDIIDSPQLRINVSDGFLYEKGDLSDEHMKLKTYDIPRNSFRLSYRWNIKKRIRITGVHFYQPSLISIKDYIIQSSSTVSIPLSNWISFTTSLVYNKVTATGRENLLVKYGFTLEKYF